MLMGDNIDLYHRKRYIKKKPSGYGSETDEDYVLFDVESNPKYENINPGTVTIEGLVMRLGIMR